MFHFVRLLVFSVLPLLSFSTSAAMTSCKITYNLKGWSFFYKEYRGTGHVSCRNGQQTNVVIVSRSGGLTFGKSEIHKGKGVISEIKNINEIYGTYVFLDAHAGATKSVEGRVMTKGEISIALSGIGRGFDLGVTLGAFSILPR